MREKKLWLVITFHTTAAAIAMEKLCRAKGLPGRLIPVPRELDEAVARRKLSSMGVEIDSLSREQADYLGVEV